jgi:hypothetical protein
MTGEIYHITWTDVRIHGHHQPANTLRRPVEELMAILSSEAERKKKLKIRGPTRGTRPSEEHTLPAAGRLAAGCQGPSDDASVPSSGLVPYYVR